MPKKTRIDLGKRFQQAFGYVGNNYGSGLQNVDYANQSGLADVFVTSDGSFEEFTISGGDFELKFAGDILGDSFGSIYAPPPMVTYDREKTIIVTPIDDSNEDPVNDAVVVERYNGGQWNINIQGILVDMVNHQFPKDKIAILRQLFDSHTTFEVTGEWWDALNIKDIYLSKFTIGGIQGYEDTVSFSLQAHSINPVLFFIKQKNKANEKIFDSTNLL